MTGFIKRSLPLLIGCLSIQSVPAQDEPPGPFVSYPDPAAAYLKRLHSKGAESSATGRLAFRTDYPGGFTSWKRDAREKLVDLLGLDRISQSAGDHKPVVHLGESFQEDGYVRRRGDIETEPGVTVPFWLLVPDDQSPGPRPLAICAHGHDRDGWNTYAGVYRDEKHRATTLGKDGDVGVQAVRRGFTTIVPATRGLAEIVSIPDLKARHGQRPCRAQLIHCLLAGRTAVGERVWDTQRLLDWGLSALPNVDSQKVVLLGNSGGGVLTVYVAALDERVTVAVPSCSLTSYTSATGFVFHCDCCLVPRAQVELGDMADIASLAVPRALLAVHGRQDSLHSFADVEAAMTRIHSVYTAAGVADHFHHEWGASGHKFYPQIMWPFIESALAR